MLWTVGEASAANASTITSAVTGMGVALGKSVGARTMVTAACAPVKLATLVGSARVCRLSSMARSSDETTAMSTPTTREMFVREGAESGSFTITECLGICLRYSQQE
jgi:hypothetical protein